MWCKKCGNELPDNAKFCKVCGERCSEIEEKTTSEKENPFENLTKKNFDGKTKKIMLIAIAIILVVVGFCVYNNSDYAKTRRYLKEGEKALAQDNYEEAGNAFEKALGIAQDSNNARAGVLKAYNSHIEKKAAGDDYSDEEYADIVESYDKIFEWMSNYWEDEISDFLKSGDYYYLSNKEECQKQYLLSFGDMQMSKEKLPAARKYYDQVIEMDKKEVGAYLRKANTYLSSAEAVSALDVIEEGLKCCVGAEDLTALKSMKEYVLSNLESTLVKQYYSSDRMNYSNAKEIAEAYHSSENSESYWIAQGEDYPNKTVYEYYENGNLKSTIRSYGTKSNMTTITKLYNENGKPVSEEDVNTGGYRAYETWEYYENEQIKMYTDTNSTSTEKKYYDEEGRLLRTESYNNESPENVYTENYNYEEGKLKSVTTSDGKGIYLNALGFPIGVDESVYSSNVWFLLNEDTLPDELGDSDYLFHGKEWSLRYGSNGELLEIRDDSARYLVSFFYDENGRIISRTQTSGGFFSSEAIYNQAYTFESGDKPSGAIKNDDGTYKAYTGYNIYTYNFVYDEYGRMSEMKVNEEKRIITYTDSGSGRLNSENTVYVDGTHWYLPEGSYETTETVYKFTYESCEEEQAMTCALDLKGVSGGISTGHLRDRLCPWVYRSFGDFYEEIPSGNILTVIGDAFANSGAYAIDGNYVQTGYYVNDEYFEINHAVITEEKEYAYEEYNSAGLLEYAIDNMNREYKYVYSYQYNGGIYQK